METLLVEHQGPVTTVRLNRPAVRNAFNATLIRELAEVFAELPGSRVVVLSGEGPAFCAGADLAWMQSSVGLSEAENRDDARELLAMFEALDAADCVVIGKVHGSALGGGVGLVACCDIVLAAPGTKFGLTEVRLGLVPAVISPFVMRKIGVAASRRYFLTGEFFDAEEALRIGLVHEVTPDLDLRAKALTDAVVKNGPRAVGEAKRLVRFVEENDAARVRDYTVSTIARLRTSAEGQEGLRAFLEKRAPEWPS